MEKARRETAQSELTPILRQRRISEREAAGLFWKQLRSWRGS